MALVGRYPRWTHICVIPREAVNGLSGWVLPPLDPATKAASRAIGAKIKKARLKAGLSQAALADKAGMTRSSYVRIEKGQTNVTIDSLVRIAKGLGLRLDVDLSLP